MLEVQVAVAKTGKYATPESGDTIEHIERPRGGFSFVMADGQGSGRGAKTLSNLVTARAIAMLKDGARDGAVARAVHDYLYGYRNGKVSATLNILSVDFSAQTIIMSRNNPCPFYIVTDSGLDIYDEPSSPIGVYPNTKPVITQHPIAPHQYFIAFTDGIFGAGSRYGIDNCLQEFLNELDVGLAPSSAELAEKLLYWSMHLDQERPGDDMSVIVLGVFKVEDERPKIRSLGLTFPVERVLKA